MFIYKLTNLINGKVYIGQTKQKPSARLNRHAFNARSGETAPLYHAIRKYGIENFSFEVIDGANAGDELSYREIHHIYAHGCLAPNGYNLKINMQHHVATKKKHSETMKKKALEPEFKAHLVRMNVLNALSRRTPVRAINIHTGEVRNYDDIKQVVELGTSYRHVEYMINGRMPYKACKGWYFEHVGRETIKKPRKSLTRRNQVKLTCKDTGSSIIFDYVKDAAAFVGINRTTGTRILKHLIDCKKYIWEYC